MRVASALLLTLFAAPAWAQDPQRGKELYETHCLSCHYERIHRRERSRSLVASLVALRIEVARRAEFTRRSFTVEDLDDIAEFLNRSHYRFER